MKFKEIYVCTLENLNRGLENRISMFVHLCLLKSDRQIDGQNIYRIFDWI